MGRGVSLALSFPAHMVKSLIIHGGEDSWHYDESRIRHVILLVCLGLSTNMFLPQGNETVFFGPLSSCIETGERAWGFR